MEQSVFTEWLKAAGIRAARTFAQTALGMLTIGAALSDIDWIKVLSVSLVASVYSILTSVATKLPEVDTSSDKALSQYETKEVDNSTKK